MPFSRITSVASGLCLDVPQFSRDDGVQIQQYRPTGGINQVWDLGLGTDPFGRQSSYFGFTIINANSRLVLDIRGGLQGDHSIVQQYHATGGSNQNWLFDSHGDAEWTITAFTPQFSLSGQVLDVVGASNAPGAKIQTFRSKGSPNQKWRLEVVYF